MKIAIHYFSGCGNTAWVANKARDCLQQAGHEIVLMQNAELAFPTQIPFSDVDLFISPVYFGGLPSNVVSYYKRLPLVANRKALFWAVCGAKSGISGWIAKSLLSERGYELIAQASVQMPDTFLFLKMSQMTPEERKDLLLNAKRKIAENVLVLSDVPPLKKTNPIVLVFGGFFYFLYYVVIRHSLGLMMTSNSNCIHCGFCTQNCPVQAIQMKNESPVWKTGCTNCFRCLNLCPVKAIDFSKYALFSGLIGALLMSILCGIALPFGFISVLFGLFFGYFVGCFIFQKMKKFFPIDKGLLLDKKQRVKITDEEKNL